MPRNDGWARELRLSARLIAVRTGTADDHSNGTETRSSRAPPDSASAAVHSARAASLRAFVTRRRMRTPTHLPPARLAHTPAPADPRSHRRPTNACVRRRQCAYFTAARSRPASPARRLGLLRRCSPTACGMAISRPPVQTAFPRLTFVVRRQEQSGHSRSGEAAAGATGRIGAVCTRRLQARTQGVRPSGPRLHGIWARQK
jgi:hypothetical protein